MMIGTTFGPFENAFVSLRTSKMSDCKHCRCTRHNEFYVAKPCVIAEVRTHQFGNADGHQIRINYLVVPYNKRPPRSRFSSNNSVLVSQSDLFKTITGARLECEVRNKEQAKKKKDAWNQR